MTQYRKNKQTIEPLETRFKHFLSSRSRAQNIDEMDISEEHQHLKRADYVLNENIIVELKSLENDPKSKIEKILKPHRDRKEFPLYFWEAPLKEVLKKLPDAHKINKDIFFSVTKSVQHCFEKADKQIGDTKKIIENPNATGVLAILNEHVSVLEPKVIAYIVRYMMNKRNKAGAYRYNNIHFVYFISEAHFQKVGKMGIGVPLMIIDGPSAADHLQAIAQFEQYNKEWGEYNNTPLFYDENPAEEKLEDAFHSFERNLAANNLTQMQRHQLWRREYRENPYLQHLNEEELIAYGEKTIEKLAPHFLKGFPKKPREETLKMMIVWTHFLEEAQMRNFDMKKLTPELNKVVGV